MSWGQDARRIARLAWPVFVGQVSVLAFSTVDTLLVARHSATDLAALAVGAAAYVTVFIGLMGVVMAVGPIVGQLFGAGRREEAGHQLHQTVWLALVLTLAGSTALLLPEPFLAISQVTPDVEAKVRDYLRALACALPASLLFTAYRGFNVAVSRPKAVMALQVAGLAVKVPLSAALVHGLPALHVPALGVAGCGLATLVAMWAQALAAFVVLRRDPFYAGFRLFAHGLLRAPHAPSLRALLKLGLPMGLSILIEVTGFAFMAIFIARLGPMVVAGHQIAANLVALLFMMPLALSHATSTLVAQRIGADDLVDARRLGWHGLQLTLLMALLLGGVVYGSRGAVVRLYTPHAEVVAQALPLVAWVAVFHTSDALQTVAAFVLRAWRIATLPMVIYAISLWGVGLGGGFMLAFNTLGLARPPWVGAQGFWAAATLGLSLAALGLCLLLAWVMRRSAATRPAPSPGV